MNAPEASGNSGAVRASRPPNRPSIGVRYGDMRTALREAALMRAQRTQGGSNSTNEVQVASPVHGSNTEGTIDETRV